MKEDATEEVDQMIDVIKKLQILRPEDSFASGVSGNELRVRVDDVLMLSGRQSGLLLSSSNHPDDEKIAEKHGVKIAVFTTTMYEKFNKRLLPLLKSISGLKKSEYDAVREYQNGIKKFPNSRMLYEKLGRLYLVQELPGFAVDIFLAYLEKNPGDVDMRKQLAFSYERMILASGPLSLVDYRQKALNEWEKLLNTDCTEEAKQRLRLLGGKADTKKKGK